MGLPKRNPWYVRKGNLGWYAISPWRIETRHYMQSQTIYKTWQEAIDHAQ